MCLIMHFMYTFNTLRILLSDYKINKNRSNWIFVSCLIRHLFSHSIFNFKFHLKFKTQIEYYDNLYILIVNNHFKAAWLVVHLCLFIALKILLIVIRSNWVLYHRYIRHSSSKLVFFFFFHIKFWTHSFFNHVFYFYPVQRKL